MLAEKRAVYEQQHIEAMEAYKKGLVSREDQRKISQDPTFRLEEVDISDMADKAELDAFFEVKLLCTCRQHFGNLIVPCIDCCTCFIC